jgi:transcriptional regulator with GAF, ATPase, and Fis domain
MRLIENTRDVNIFLYKNHKLSFGAALDADGTRNRPWAKPRTNGLTYTVARRGEIIIVEDMKSHPLFHNVPAYWSGSIIGIPLKVGDTVVGVMNLSRSTTGGFSSSELRLLSHQALSRSRTPPISDRRQASDDNRLFNRRPRRVSSAREHLPARHDGPRRIQSRE